MNQTIGIVLAGGASKRMGKDKAMLMLNGTTLLERASKAVSSITGKYFVSAKAAYPGYPFIADEKYGFGPVAGIAASLTFAKKENAEGILAIACDLPLLESNFLGRLFAEKIKANILVRAFQSEITGWQEMTAAWYSVKALPFFINALEKGQKKLRLVLPENRMEFIKYCSNDAWRFLNCNTPEDIAKAEKILMNKKNSYKILSTKQDANCKL